MADKQGLTGAYYGPSIPPPQQTNYRRRRDRGCCCCLLSLFFKILIAIIVLAAIALFVFWIIVRPQMMKFHITEAKLTEFNLTADSKLHYNLALNFTIRNPNKKLGIYQDKIDGRAYYEDVRFTTKVLTYVGLLKKKTTEEHGLVFQGQQLVLLKNNEIVEFNKQKNAGVFDINVKFNLRMRWRLGDYISGDFKPKVRCGSLKVPLIINGVSTATFQRKKCRVRFY